MLSVEFFLVFIHAAVSFLQGSMYIIITGFKYVTDSKAYSCSIGKCFQFADQFCKTVFCNVRTQYYEFITAKTIYFILVECKLQK